MELHSLRAALTLVLQRNVSSSMPVWTNSAGNHHPWTKPWTGPMGLRPMLYYYATRAGHRLRGRQLRQGRDADRHTGDVVAGPTDVGVGDLADVRTQGLAIRRGPDGLRCRLPPVVRDARPPDVLLLRSCTRPVHGHGFALVLGDVLGKASASVERRTTGLLAVSLYIGLVVANFVYLWPILTAMPITPESWQNHLWLPSWK